MSTPDVTYVDLAQQHRINRWAPGYSRLTPDRFTVALLNKRSGAQELEIHCVQDTVLPVEGKGAQDFEKVLLLLATLQLTFDDARRLSDAINQALGTSEDRK